MPQISLATFERILQHYIAKTNLHQRCIAFWQTRQNPEAVEAHSIARDHTARTLGAILYRLHPTERCNADLFCQASKHSLPHDTPLQPWPSTQRLPHETLPSLASPNIHTHQLGPLPGHNLCCIPCGDRPQALLFFTQSKAKPDKPTTITCYAMRLGTAMYIDPMHQHCPFAKQASQASQVLHTTLTKPGEVNTKWQGATYAYHHHNMPGSLCFAHAELYS